MTRLQRIGGLAAVAIAMLTGAVSVLAQTFPSRPVKIIVPFPPGGSADAVARIIAQKVSEEWQQPVLVENKPGGGTIIASTYVASSAPDGYVLYLIGVITHASSGVLYKNLSFDALKSFAPVGQISVSPFVLVVNSSITANTVKELVELAKSKPGGLTYGSSGSGGGAHLAGYMLARATDINLVHVPFKGTAPAVASALGGQVDLLIADISVMPHVRSGKLRALAVTTARQSPLVPGVPTLADAGVTGVEVPSATGILAPAGTPREIVMKINASMNRALSAADVRQRLSSQGFDSAPTTPEEFSAFIAAEYQKYSRIIPEAGVKID